MGRVFVPFVLFVCADPRGSVRPAASDATTAHVSRLSVIPPYLPMSLITIVSISCLTAPYGF